MNYTYRFSRFDSSTRMIACELIMITLYIANYLIEIREPKINVVNARGN